MSDVMDGDRMRQTKVCLMVVVPALAAFVAGTVLAAPMPAGGRAIVADPVVGANDPLIGSKHDFTGLNRRAGVRAMGGVSFSDYGNPCIYCHLPPEQSSVQTEQYGGVAGWNRVAPSADHYKLYDSVSMDAPQSSPNSSTLLCLSCHDGTMALDMVLFKPAGFQSRRDAAMHMKMNGGNELTSCGKCHNGVVAHDIAPKVVGQDLMNDHPVSFQYGGLNWKDKDFRVPHQAGGFNNGVALYGGNVECATCHDVHNSTQEVLLATRKEILCATCHSK